MNAELARFGVVGVAALLVHLAMVSLWLVPAGLAPLFANVFAFLTAFVVSYLGHRHLTFCAGHVAHRQALPRFFAVACTGFAVNESLYFVLLHDTPFDYRVALLIVLATVAAQTFALGKLWAFAGTARP
ncbi:GtrA family protein [Crenobacter cavernae]|uniref:GtrA family protein n=1 Tax=Crenobacter cavernae TaxID=2290923 RepID=A0A345Y7M5_9NEIS|nr:GtrA family protein [Crenobacter cavernae]AXK39927.1 GtrA family protein [Crenobacter cavernae]